MQRSGWLTWPVSRVTLKYLHDGQHYDELGDLLTAHQARVRGWAGAIVKSEWRAILMSSLSRRPRGHIFLALSGPRPTHDLPVKLFLRY